MSDEKQLDKKPIKDEELDKVAGGYVLERNPVQGPHVPGEPQLPTNPLKHAKPC